jgi:uncharacterized protein YjbI with pentapeptide repeats
MKTLTNGTQYFEISFKKLELPEARCKDIEFEECQFLDCDFSGAAFCNCKFVNCLFERCNLSLLDITKSRLFGVSFQESKLVGVDWTKATWAVYHVDFELRFQRCILNDASFFGLTLNKLILDECKLHDVDFREGNFNESIMTYCDFARSLFMRTSLLGADFTESSGYAINILENPIKGAKFSRHEALNLLECLEIELID